MDDRKGDPSILRVTQQGDYQPRVSNLPSASAAALLDQSRS